MQGKLDEIDKLIKQADYMRTELHRITTKYDLDGIDENKRALHRYRQWAAGMTYAASGVGPLLEALFRCGLCSNIAINAVVIEPCNHVFCNKCLVNQGFHDKCKSCGTEKTGTQKLEIIQTLLSDFDPIVSTIEKSLKQSEKLEDDDR